MKSIAVPISTMFYEPFHIALCIRLTVRKDVEIAIRNWICIALSILRMDGFYVLACIEDSHILCRHVHDVQSRATVPSQRSSLPHACHTDTQRLCMDTHQDRKCSYVYSLMTIEEKISNAQPEKIQIQ
jgi:hypothetical protein